MRGWDVRPLAGCRRRGRHGVRPAADRSLDVLLDARVRHRPDGNGVSPGDRLSDTGRWDRHLYEAGAARLDRVPRLAALRAYVALEQEGERDRFTARRSDRHSERYGQMAGLVAERPRAGRLSARLRLRLLSGPAFQQADLLRGVRPGLGQVHHGPCSGLCERQHCLCRAKDPGGESVRSGDRLRRPPGCHQPGPHGRL